MKMAAKMMAGMSPEDMERMTRMAQSMGGMPGMPGAPGGAGGSGAAGGAVDGAAAPGGLPPGFDPSALPADMMADMRKRMQDPEMLKTMKVGGLGAAGWWGGCRVQAAGRCRRTRNMFSMRSTAQTATRGPRLPAPAPPHLLLPPRQPSPPPPARSPCSRACRRSSWRR